ncbi:MAG: serine hydrolase domain-containing protein [Calditrichia bacterium]
MPRETPVDSKIFAREYAKAIQSAAGKIDELKQGMGLPAVSVSVGLNGEVLWARATGFSDLAESIPVSINTKFRIGSVSKSVTSLALGKLYESGDLDLDAPIQTYVPYFPGKAFPITARQLASHTAGIRHYSAFSLHSFPPHETFNNRRYNSVRESLTLFENDDLLFEPGSQFNYSTYGYTLLSAAIEGASGQDFLTFMQEMVFDDLSMLNTAPERNVKQLPNTATFYIPMMGRYHEMFGVSLSCKWGGGGYLSTSTDLVKMVNALLTHNYLDSATVSLLFTPQKLSSGEMNPQNYSMGWRNATVTYSEFNGEPESFPVAHHGGQSGGSSAFLLIFPKQKLVVAMMTNINHSEKFRSTAYQVAKAFLLQMENSLPIKGRNQEVR